MSSIYMGVCVIRCVLGTDIEGRSQTTYAAPPAPCNGVVSQYIVQLGVFGSFPTTHAETNAKINSPTIFTHTRALFSRAVRLLMRVYVYTKENKNRLFQSPWFILRLHQTQMMYESVTGKANIMPMLVRKWRRCLVSLVYICGFSRVMCVTRCVWVIQSEMLKEIKNQ